MVGFARLQRGHEMSTLMMYGPVGRCGGFAPRSKTSILRARSMAETLEATKTNRFYEALALPSSSGTPPRTTRRKVWVRAS
jgi:hypothetical protein